MSTSTSFTHPQIRLCVSPNGWKPDGTDASPNQNDGGATFPHFDALPAEVQARIFQMWLQKGHTIHCFSRLDPFAAPASWPVSQTSSGMYNRFYWGEERLLNLEKDTVHPRDVLGVLLVSKGFYFKGVHAFYGLNTFAFSSIGELGRFCKGIGQERAARLQHVELTWAGSQYLTVEHTFSGKTENWDSARTRPFALLLHLRRLRTLAVFLNESGPCQRRKYESPAVKAHLLHATTDQPNFRNNRCLRTLQGVDYVYALRGLDWVRLYDVWAMNRDNSPIPPLVPIRDSSFLADVNRTVTIRKSGDEARNCELRNLPPLFPTEEGVAAEQAQAAANPMKPWDPSGADWLSVEQFYDTFSTAKNAPKDGVHDLNAGSDDDDDGTNVPVNDIGRGHHESVANGEIRGDRTDNRNNRGLFVDDDDDDDDRDGHPEYTARPGVQAGPSRLQRPTMGLAHRAMPPASPTHLAAELTTSAGPSRPGATTQKRPSPGIGGTSFKRQRQADDPPSPAQQEQRIRDFLGELVSCGSIAPLLNPFAANLKRSDWRLVKHVLEERQDARESRTVFNRLLKAEGEKPYMKSSAGRIASAFLSL